MFTIDQQFHLDNDFMEEYRQKPVPWGGGLLSQSVFYRTYSRAPDQSPFGRQEHFADVLQRCIEGVLSIRKTWYKLIGQRWDDRWWQKTAQQMYAYAFEMKWLPPGRSLYALGTGYPETRGNAALNNCGFVDITTITMADAAAWLMDHLMLGVGVGFRIPNEPWVANATYYERPDESNPYTFVIPDSREGWVEATRLLIQSYQRPMWGEARTQAVYFDYSQIRPKGSRINGFGGTASGPQPLQEMHETMRRLLDAESQHEKEFSTKMQVDLMNLIGVCVIAGNVRRSAEISVGSPHDSAFVHLKNYELNPDRVEWGWMSNNTVVMQYEDDFALIPEMVRIITGPEGNGEPGFMNAINIEGRGRYKDKVRNTDWLRPDAASGMNPCGEIPLESYELCNLVEVFPTRCATKAEWQEALRFATIFASTVALLPSHDERTNTVVARNRRIGVSVSGIADWVDSSPFYLVHNWLDTGYDLVRYYNTALAKEAGVPPSIRLTTVKPSGTVSLLPWVSPGMHHPVKNRFIRRVTVGVDDPVAEILRKAGVPNEPLETDPRGSLSFQFPMESANGGRTRSVENVPIFEQCALAQFLANVWADNAVSFTGTVAAKERDQLEKAVTLTLPYVKSLSFLMNNDEHQAYRQAPYEGITVSEYNRRMAEIDTTVDWSGFSGSDGSDPRYCDADVCEVPL